VKKIESSLRWAISRYTVSTALAHRVLTLFQVYKREFSWMSCISFALSISGLYASVATTYIYPLVGGGAASAVWSWLISGWGCMCIALSVSEIVSAYPTSGGMYFTCKYLAPEAWVPEISWLCGWLTVVGQIAGLASTEYGTAQLLLAAVSMNMNFSYLPTTNQTVGVMSGMLIFHGILNSMSTSWLEKLTRTYVVFHVAVLVACCIALLAVDDNKHISSYVWTNVTPESGWTPKGFSFLFGFLSISWTMTDYDATAHIAEEIRNPEIKAPWAITIALGFTYVAGWLFTIVLTYCSGDIATLLDSPIEQPVAQIFYNVLGRRAGCFFTVCAAIILNFTGMTGLQGAARAFWAVARDEMVPLSRVWTKINKRTQTPIYSVWLVTIACILINLIALGSYTAIAAIFSITAIAYDWSYCIPIICKMWFGKFERGPFHLGRYSYWINLWAVIWTAFASVIFIFPEYRPVTDINVSIPFLVSAIVSANRNR
jgi:amino acid permease (GABA permease)